MDQEKINELLVLIAQALATTGPGGGNIHVKHIREWMAANAPEYLNPSS